MSEELLDDFWEEQLQYRKPVGGIWMLFGGFCLCHGLGLIYQNSDFTNELLAEGFLGVVPIYFAYESIITGILALVIGWNILKNSPNLLEHLLIYIGIIIIFCGIQLLSFDNWDILFWQLLSSGVLLLISLANYKKEIDTGKLFKKKRRDLLLLLMALLPALLSNIMDYQFFNFLH